MSEAVQTVPTMAAIEPVKAAIASKRKFAPKVATKPQRRPRIEEVNPDVPRLIAETYVKTGSKAQTKRLTGLGKQTVTDILLRNPEALQEARKKLGNKALEVSELYLDRALQTVDQAKGTSAAIGAKVLGQMALEQHDLMPSLITVNLAVLSESGEALEKLARETEQIRAQLARPIVATSDCKQVVEVTQVIDDKASG